jgi:hypothetical protein
MDNYEVSHATGDSYLEMEQRIACLRSLVCDLLKTNQELRQILLEAGIDWRHNERLRLANERVGS